MGTILENMRRLDLEKSCSELQFSNPVFKKDPNRVYFGNGLAISDISKKYIEKYKAADGGAKAAAPASTSLLGALRKRNMDEATKNM